MKNKDILKLCPNFYKIVNFEYLENDFISENIINIYQEYVFNVDYTNSDNLKEIKELDKIIARYIDDYYFRVELQYNLKRVQIKKNESNLLKVIIENIFRIFNLYEEGTTRKIHVTRWI